MEKIIDWGPTILALGFPIIGVAFSAWSFAFAEDGAVPDRYAQEDGEVAQRVLEHGFRYRARRSSAVLFRCGALTVIAGVFMNFADSRSLGVLSLPAVLSYAIVLFAVAYLVKTTRDLWLDRRENAFSAFYGRDVFPYYKDKGAVRALFFRRNRMPYWSIFKRSFTYYDLTAEELITTLRT